MYFFTASSKKCKTYFKNITSYSGSFVLFTVYDNSSCNYFFQPLFVKAMFTDFTHYDLCLVESEGIKKNYQICDRVSGKLKNHI